MKRIFEMVLLLGLLALAPMASTHAQENLLQNPGFNDSGSYRASRQFQRGDFNFAEGWDGWQTNSPSNESWQNIDPIAFPHTGSFKREGDASQNIGRGDATFTAAALQIVDGIAEGTTLSASVWVLQDSDEGKGSRTRIGIGSNAGANPLSGAITWSPWMRSIDSWQQISVEATVPAGSVTVFIYSTQDQPNPGNQNFYDQASLTIVGEGEPDVGSESGEVNVPPPPTSPPVAPFVSAQGADESGRIEHTVQSGDTLAAIAVAYGVSVAEIRELNNLSGAFLNIGQVLLIREAPEPPPASDDDTTEDAASADVTEAATADEEDQPEEVENTTSDDSGFISPTPQSVSLQATAAQAEETEALEVTEEAEETAAVEMEPMATMPPPATATLAAEAPVANSAAAGDPLDTNALICVTFFEDSNQNRLRDPGEELLADGELVLTAEGGAEQRYTTDGETEPYCFEGLAPGRYTLAAQAPPDYGITTSDMLVVSVQPGQRFTLSFGAAFGVEVASVPTDAPSQTADIAPEILEEGDPVDQLRNIAGLIAIGAAGVVLVGGAFVGLVARRFG